MLSVNLPTPRQLPSSDAAVDLPSVAPVAVVAVGPARAQEKENAGNREDGMIGPELKKKYGAHAVENGLRLQPKSFARRLALRDSLDQHFTKAWVDFVIEGFGDRAALDDRTRFLVLVGQFTMAKSIPALEDAIRAALAVPVPAREVLEIILQCAIYGGNTAVDPALDIFASVVEDLGLMDELKISQLPMEGYNPTRKLEEEQKTWHQDDVADPRREKLMAKHDWRGISTGLRLRPKHHLNILDYLDSLDENFADIWVNFCYRSMYSRWIVDDKTRLLCMVGDCMAVGETTQARAHIRGSMRAGAKPREVMEVILQSCQNFGMPTMLRGLGVFVKIMTEDGRLDEIGNPRGAVE
jgi:alkylhydroperoxidase/carboxymuconolactone decarboxylase family protein YurZ